MQSVSLLKKLPRYTIRISTIIALYVSCFQQAVGFSNLGKAGAWIKKEREKKK